MSHTEGDGQCEDGGQFRRHAGTVIWPTTPDVLTDSTRCPACFTPLTALVCQHCGLNLAHPAAGELAVLSRSASNALSQRVEIIGRIRYDAAQAPTTEPLPPAVSSLDDPAVPPPAPSIPAIVATSDAQPSRPTTPVDVGARAAGAPRRSGVQVALLITGVSLLSVFAVFFLVYAFLNYGIIWRSVIIAAITAAAFVSASLLRRKNLVASAEGLAVFAVVLVYLDAYALRVNDFFDLASADAATYWGATITIASVGFIAWHRVAGMRAASLVGWLGLAIGAGVLAWGFGDGVDTVTRAFTAMATAAVIGLVQTLIPRPPFRGTVERMAVLSSSAVALVAASLCAWAVEPLSDFGGTIAVAVVAVIAFTHAAVAATGRAPSPAVRAFGFVFATIGGVSAAAAASATAVRIVTEGPGFTTFVPAVSAAAVAVLLEVAFHRLPIKRLRQSCFSAAWGAVAVLGLTALVPLTSATAPIALGLLEAAADPLAEDAGSGLATAHPTSDVAVLALASVVALAAALWLLSGSMHRRGPIIAWGTTIVLVLGGAQLPALWMSLAVWLLLSILAFALLLTQPELRSALRPCWASTLVVATALTFALGWASLDTWLASTVATIVVLVASRRLMRGLAARAAAIGVAALVFLIGVVAATRHLVWPETPPTGIQELNAAGLLAVVSSAIVALSAIGYRRGVTTLDRRTLFWIAGPASGVSALMTWNSVTELARYDQPVVVLPQPLGSLIASILLLGALLLWAALPANTHLRLERGAASVAVGPAVLWVVDSFARLLDLPAFAQSVVPITAALLVAVGALALTLLRPHGIPRWVREAGIALVGVPAVAVAVATDAPAAWLVLLLGAVTVLLVAISPDGLFTSGSKRRHLGWGALVLATAGLWWRLSDDRIDALEPYVLPLAGMLLVIAALIHRAVPKTESPFEGQAAPIVALSGLLIGILPLAANSLTGDPTRAYIMFGISGALLVASSLAVRPSAQRYLDVMAVAGAAGVLVTAGGRALLAPSHTLVTDSWVGAALVVLLVAAFGQARLRRNSSDHPRMIVSQMLVGVAMLMLFGIEAQGYSDPNLGAARAIATVSLLSAIHVAAVVVNSAPLTRVIAHIAIAFAAAGVAAGAVTGALDPIELGSVSVAAALLVTGRIRMDTEPATRSWRALALGLVVLLVPSLLATIDDPELWRLVGLGIVSVTVLVVGAVRRLQAPFILGLAASLIHGFATFAPQIRAVYESQEWWLWAGLAGIVLVLLAIRYERRIQNLKDAVGRIAALR